MSSNNQYGRGPLHSRSWDEREEQHNQPQGEHLGGFTDAPGSNYAAGTFSGEAQGLGYNDDGYRGYYGGGNSSRDFAAHYMHEYGRDDYHRPQDQRDVQHEAYLSGGNYGLQRWEHYDRGERAGSERVEGPHRGKGPRNYKRSDSRIHEDVSDRLSDDPYIDASHVHIAVQEGNVVLSGHVENRDAKRRAVDLAESVRGVANVENRLRIGQGMMENIAHAVTAAIGDVTLGPDISTVETPKKGRKRKTRE